MTEELMANGLNIVRKSDGKMVCTFPPFTASETANQEAKESMEMARRMVEAWNNRTPSPDPLREGVEERLSALEQNSHPPIDLEPAIREIVCAEVARQLDNIGESE